MKNRKNLLKIITCAFFVSGYSQIEKKMKVSLNLRQQQQEHQHSQHNQYNKFTSVFK